MTARARTGSARDRGSLTLELAILAPGVLILLGLLRLLQTEWDRSARGNLSWLAYLIVLVVAAGLIALAVSRIKRDSLAQRLNDERTK